MASGETDLRDRLRTCLEDAATDGTALTYADAARALGLTGPQKIHRVALALEHLMAEDAAAGRPFIAALVISRARGGLPAPGFFEAAQRLGRLEAESDSVAATAFYRAEVAAAVAQFGRAPGPEAAEADRQHKAQKEMQRFLGARPRKQSDRDN